MLYDEVAGTYSINQTKYVKDMCNKFLPKGSVGVKTPMTDVNLSNDMCPKSESETLSMKDIPYKAGIGVYCGWWQGHVLTLRTRFKHVQDTVSILDLCIGKQFCV